MSEEIKPCPFCGGPAEVDGVAAIVSCNNSGCSVASIAYGDDMAAGIAAWNRRAPFPPDPEKWDDIEAAGAVLDGITHPIEGNLEDTEAYFWHGLTRHVAQAATLGEALNSIRRQIGITERK